MSERYGTRRRASTLLLALILAAGCRGGGGSKPLTRDQYAAKADAICAKYKQQLKFPEGVSSMSELAHTWDQGRPAFFDVDAPQLAGLCGRPLEPLKPPLQIVPRATLHEAPGSLHSGTRNSWAEREAGTHHADHAHAAAIAADITVVPAGVLFAAALKAAGIKDRVRPFHDLRHTAITLDAASGASGPAIMTKAGHSTFATTQTYLHLAGTVFREEAPSEWNGWRTADLLRNLLQT